MTAAAETLDPGSPAESVAYGRAVHDRATNPERPRSVRDVMQRKADALLEWIELYDAILGLEIHPAEEWHELAGDDEAQRKAETWAAEAVRDLAAELVRAFPACEVRADVAA